MGIIIKSNFSGTILYAFFSTCKEKNADYDKIKKCYKIEKKTCIFPPSGVYCPCRHAARCNARQSQLTHYYTIMDNNTISKLIIAAATNTTMPASERALLVSNLLKGKDFKATYHKARPDYDEQGNELLRECVGTLNYEELEKHSQAYRTWLEEKEWKAAKGVVQRKEAYEYGNVQYWDYEKDSFRNFKIDNLVSIELS